MKTKTLVTTVALAGVLMASASVAMANATLSASSGTQTFSASGPQYGATILSASFTDGWSVSVSTADVAGGPPTSIDLDQSSTGTTLKPLVISFEDGWFTQSGPAVFSATGSATSDLTISIALYSSAGLLLPTSVLPPTMTSHGVSQYGTFLTGTIPSQLGDYEEVLTITPSLREAQSVSLDTGLTIVPDGGTTLALLGSVFAGLAGVRSKFGSKA